MDDNRIRLLYIYYVIIRYNIVLPEEKREREDRQGQGCIVGSQ